MTDQQRPGRSQTGRTRRRAGSRHLGDRIRKYRNRQGLSQEVLAHRIDRSEGWMLLVENGKAEPGYLDLLNIARVLKLDVVQLFEDEVRAKREERRPESSKAQPGVTLSHEAGMMEADPWSVGIDPSEWSEEMKRRAFLRAAATVTGAAAAGWWPALTDPAVAALERIRHLEGSLGETVDGLDELAFDLGMSFFYEPPGRIQPRIAALVEYASHLLSISSATYERTLLDIVGRGLALSANAQFDLGDLATARVSARAAFAYGGRAGDAKLMAWARDFQGMMAGYRADFLRSLQYVEEGRSLAPPASGIAVRLLGGQARAYARLGRVEETMEVLRQAEVEYAALPDSEVSGSLFGIGAMQVPYIASSATIWLDTPEITASRARQVIDFDSGSGGPGSSPTRLALARMNLAVALMQQDKPDEACHSASLALGAQWPSSSVLLRARELHTRLTRQWPDVSEVRQLGERYRQAALPVTGNSQTSN